MIFRTTDYTPLTAHHSPNNMNRVESESVQSLVEHLFRRSAGRMVATLARIFGPRHLELAEEVVQDALLRALRVWPFRGIPRNPTAWLIQAAKNLALDRLRRDANLRAKEADLRRWAEERTISAAAADDPFPDDELRLIFMCCHDALAPESRVALTLKTLGGFGVPEIARAFLTPETTIAQRIVRAKRKIDEDRVPLQVPTPSELPKRLDSVLEVLYLMFNEGYAACQGENLVREDLIDESMRLTAHLLRLPTTCLPQVHALLALMLFQAARLATRVDSEGNLLLLANQDRSRWDSALIERGFMHLKEAGVGDVLTVYHVEAGIASCHALAPTWERTDWRKIVAYYDLLLKVNPSPVAVLNRAVAVAELEGPQAGLRELDALGDHPQLRAYYLLPATRGELLRRVGDHAGAMICFRQALGMTFSAPIKRFLHAKQEACG
jgi:RNA polymerase sigma-70 factor (ECF subfamily)